MQMKPNPAHSKIDYDGKTPHPLIEGMIISSYAFSLKHLISTFVVNDANSYKIIEKALQEAYDAQLGLLGKNILGSCFDQI